MSRIARALRDNCHGQGLIEALVAVAVLGAVAVVFLSGLSTTYTAVAIQDKRTSAESLARSEFEYVKDSVYWPLGFSYEIPATPDDPPPWDPDRTTLESHYEHYSIQVTGQPIHPNGHFPLAAGLDQGIQEITVEVYLQGDLVLTTRTYKVHR